MFLFFRRIRPLVQTGGPDYQPFRLAMIGNIHMPLFSGAALSASIPCAAHGAPSPKGETFYKTSLYR
jgi:hypothetical protein